MASSISGMKQTVKEILPEDVANLIGKCVGLIRPLVKQRDRRSERIRELQTKIMRATNGTVVSGLFSGLRLTSEISWGEGSRGDIGSKLLGFYEMELQPVLEAIVKLEPDLIANVGCAEGFYALGLARLLPNVQVLAFDIDERAQKICKLGRQINEINGNFEVRGYCSPEALQKIAEAAERPVLLIDCEGFERDLLLRTSYDYPSAHIIVECHDFLDRDITTDLVRKFSRTHVVEVIEQGGRNPHISAIMRGWGESDMWLVVSENRPESMHWLYMRPRLEIQAVAPEVPV